MNMNSTLARILFRDLPPILIVSAFFLGILGFVRSQIYVQRAYKAEAVSKALKDDLMKCEGQKDAASREK